MQAVYGIEEIRLAAAVLTLQRQRDRASAPLPDLTDDAETIPTSAPWSPLPHQVAPPGDWWLWLLLGGRGAGKTDADAAYVDEQASGEKPIRIGIIAPTLGDAIESCVNGPSGLRAHNPKVRLVGGPGGLHVRWPNGSEAKLFGANSPQDVERLRAGGNRHLVWAEELAAWRHLEECWDHMSFGLRLGPRPHVVASTTPKPLKLIKELLKDEATAVTRATTYDNPHLSPVFRARIEKAYGGTRLGRQELGGELLEDVPGAMWQYAWIDDRRVDPKDVPNLVRVAVAIDPAATATDESDETGISVVGLGDDGDLYVQHCRGYRLSPNGWATRAIDLYDEHEADKILGEVNNGGDMVESTIRSVRRWVNFEKVVASRGKTLRAEPIASLYEQGHVHHVRGAGIERGHDHLEELEDQMTTFPVSNEHDDLVDALVYACTELTGNVKRQLHAY